MLLGYQKAETLTEEMTLNVTMNMLKKHDCINVVLGQSTILCVRRATRTASRDKGIRVLYGKAF